MARILIVDDDTDILKMAEGVLGAAGHTVFTAEDAMRAMDFLNQIGFDLLLSDVNMPHYSGLELVRTIRGDDKFKDLSIAMLTGMRERKDIAKAVTAGVDDYIVKPLDPLLLIQKVNSLFEKRPPHQYPEIKLNNSSLSQGSLHRPIQVESVSELGVVVRTEVPLKPGMVLDISCEFFRELGVDPPPMKVLNSEFNPQTGECKAQLIFLGAREAVLQKIRRWLYSHGTSARNAA